MTGWLLRKLFPSGKDYPATPLAQYPTAEDAAQARAGGYGYGDEQSAYIEGQAGNVFGDFKKGTFTPAPPTGKVSQSWDRPQTNLTPGQKGVSEGLLRDNQDAWTRAHLASNYLPIAALGLEGRNATADLSGTPMTIAGAYSPDRDKVWFSNEDPSSLLHEATHRGLKQVKDRPELPERLRKRIGTEDEEGVVRQLLQAYAGDPEQSPLAVQMKRAAAQTPVAQNDIAALNALVAQMVKERRPGGPR